MSVLIAIASTQDLSTGGQPSDSASWIKLVLGLLLMVAALGQWRKRPKPGEKATMPAWMSKIDTMKPAAAIGLGFLLSAVNPKNLLLIAGSAVTISQADLSSTDTTIVVAVFTLIGACTVAIPTLGYLFLGAKIQPRLDGAKTWLSANNTTVMAVLLLVIGVSLFGKDLGACFDVAGRRRSTPWLRLPSPARRFSRRPLLRRPSWPWTVPLRPWASTSRRRRR